MVYRPLMFFPTPFPEDIVQVPDNGQFKGQEVYFEGDMGQVLHGWYWHNPNAKYTFLFSHGNSGNLSIRVETSKYLLNSGCSVFVYDYQGFGKSTGRPSVEGICSDAEAAYDFLVSEFDIEREDVLLYGESLGAAVTTHLSSVRQCSGMILQSGFSSLERIAKEHFPMLTFYPKKLFPSPPLDSLSILKNPHPPVLFIHGAQDTVIPFKHSQSMFAGSVGRKELLKLDFAGHAQVLSSDNEKSQNTIKNFVHSVG